MNYEQKYKEALEKARQFSEHPLQEDSSSIVEYIFPELKESEDEKIRKWLIDWAKAVNWSEQFTTSKEQVLAWLEKQGVQKPADEVLKIRQEVYQSGYNDGYKHGIEDMKQGEHIPAWSEEDERMCRNIINDIANDKSVCKFEISREICDGQISWLKSLIQRFN